jgi:hypothetical protein
MLQRRLRGPEHEQQLWLVRQQLPGGNDLLRHIVCRPRHEFELRIVWKQLHRFTDMLRRELYERSRRWLILHGELRLYIRDLRIVLSRRRRRPIWCGGDDIDALCAHGRHGSDRLVG